MRKRFDVSASERIMGTFVLLGVFIVFSVILTSMMSVVVAKEKAGRFDYATGYETIGISGDDQSYYMRDPTWGYNITPDDISSIWEHDSEYSNFFTAEDEDTLEVQVIMDNEEYDSAPVVNLRNDAEYKYRDYIMIYTEYGWWSSAETSIPFSDIVTWTLKSYGNLSVVPFTLHNDNYALMVRTSSDYMNHSLLLMNGLFNMRIGELDEGLDYKNLSAWSILQSILTLDLPNTHPVIDMFLTVAVWTAVAFVAWTVLTRTLPNWLSGGG